MSGYIGNIPVPQATQTRDLFTATAGQTTFATGGYAPGFLDVYLNGVKLTSADFTATNGSDVVLTAPASLDDTVEVVAFSDFVVANLATVASTGDYTDLINTPAPFDPNTLATVATTGAYSDLSGTPALNSVATSGAYSDLSGTPTLAAVATTGDYNDLLGKPTLGTAAATSTGDYATAAQGTLADSALQSGDNISSLTNNVGYTTNVGDITGVTAGSGLSGGGTSGSVTLNHADTSSQGSVNNSGSTVIQDITLDTYGHITGINSTTISSGVGSVQKYASWDGTGSVSVFFSAGVSSVSDNGTGLWTVNYSGNLPNNNYVTSMNYGKGDAYGDLNVAGHYRSELESNAKRTNYVRVCSAVKSYYTSYDLGLLDIQVVQ